MLSTVKISNRQMTIITCLFSIGTTILVAPSTLAANAQQDAWICALLGNAVGLGLAWLYISVGLFYPKNNLLEINERILGKWLGWLVSCFFLFTMLLSSAQVLFYIGNFLKTNMFPETPIIALHILFLLVVMLAAHLGLETFARSIELFVPLLLLLFFSLIFFLFPSMEIENIQPILEADGKSLVKGTLTFASMTYLTLPTLLVFFPVCLTDPRSARKYFIAGGLIAGLKLSMVILVSILVLGPDGSILYAYPSYTLAQRISIGNFLQRVEAIVAILWFFTIFVKLSMYFYAGLISMTHVFRLRTYKPLIIPTAFVVAVFSLIVYPNTAYMAKWDVDAWFPYSLIFGLFYPLLLLVVGLIRAKTKPGRDPS